MKLRYIILLSLCLLFSCRPQSEGLSGKVVSVADGDTMTIQTRDGRRIKVRLEGIDAPEKGQDYGTKARNHLNDLCYGKIVTITHKGEDQYGRVLGVVYLGYLNVNEEMVRVGLAWYYSYFVTDIRLDSLDKEARRKKLNIWSMDNPVPPHQFRKSKR